MGSDPFGTSFLEYALYRDEGRSFVSSGLGTPRLFNLTRSGRPERLRGAAVMAGYLSTLGVKPVLGRVVVPDEDRPGGPAIALISYDLWQKRFGGDRGVIGRSLNLEGRSHAVVGVMPPGFDMPYSAEVWVPMQVSIESQPIEQRAANANEFVARLKPGISLEPADTELKGVARRLEREYPQIRRGWSYAIVSLRSQLLADLQGRTHRSLVVLVVAVGFLLLICCANVASLLLARGVTREGEIAIRLSLGAGCGRLVRQLLTESMLLAVLGGGAGMLLAFWIQPLLAALNPIQTVGYGPFLTDFRIDGRVLWFSLALTLLTGVTSGLSPALKAAAPTGLMTALKRREQRAGSRAGSRRSLGALAVGEMAIAATLLVGGGLMVQSFRRLQESDLGFRPENRLMMELPLTPAKYPGLTQQVQFMQRPWMTVVGVVMDVKEDRFSSRIDRPAWYLPYEQQTFALPVSLPQNLLVRTAGDATGIAAAVRETIQSVDPDQPVANVMPMQEYLGDVLVTERFSAVLMGTLAALGLLLAALGLYGVMAYSVGQRTGEIGLRMALGARPHDVLWLVIGRGVALVVIGLGLGVAGAWTLTRLLASTLYRVSPTDPTTFTIVALVLAAVAVLACWLPARRTTRVNPMVALRCE